MANPSRNPVSQQFANVSPPGAAVSSPPASPKPGPVQADPLPLLAFTPPPSPCQTLADLSAVSGNPGMAGPICTMPSTPFQDLGQPMGQTVITPPDGDTASSGS